MARIKAKPMNRLPIAPPAQIPNKNGFRATPPPPTTATYDPSTAAYAAATQQRFVYANGASLPGSVPYGGQVMFVSIFSMLLFCFIHIKNYWQKSTQPFPQQQFYPGLMHHQWSAAPPPTGQNYYELSSVFSANGLAPQVSFATTKPHSNNNNTSSSSSNNRFNNNHRANVRNKRTPNHDHRQQQQQQQQQEQQIIVTDLGSQKSYIDLTPKLVASSLEQYSRISVIRTALSNQIGQNESSSYADLSMENFYQEKPMDFSPKNKFTNGNTGGFEMGRNFTMVS